MNAKVIMGLRAGQAFCTIVVLGMTAYGEHHSSFPRAIHLSVVCAG